jgi:hypothetical protein
MTVEERSRRHLQEALVHSIGADQTDTLMGYLPPTGWADVATKDDLNKLAVELRAEFRVGLADLRGEMNALRNEIHQLAMELRVELHQSLRSQLYWMVGLVVTLIAAQLAATTALIATR